MMNNNSNIRQKEKDKSVQLTCKRNAIKSSSSFLSPSNPNLALNNSLNLKGEMSIQFVIKILNILRIVLKPPGML